MTDLFESNLWGKVDYLHERYQREHTHISNFLDMLTKFQIACLEFSKTISSILNKNYILSESNTSTIYQSMEKFYKTLLMHSEAFKETSESLKINSIPVLKSLSETFQKEKEMYNNYVKARTIYFNNKTTLNKLKKEFIQKATECETKIYEAKKASMYPTLPPEQVAKLEHLGSEYLTNTAIYEDRYIQQLNETNKTRETEINLQKKIQNYYYNIDIDINGKEKMMTGFFISCLKRMYNVINDEIFDLNEKYKNINFEKDIKEFIKINKVNTKPDEQIRFTPYKAAPEISDESILNANVTKSKENKNLEVSLEVILIFQKILKYVRTDLNMDKERKKSKLRNISYKLFWPAEDTHLEPNEKKELYNLFKEKNFMTYFLMILSRQRTKGYKKSKKVMEDLTEIFNIILEKAEKEKNLDESINCIILSQTYFCEEKGNNGEIKKVYILDGIRNNKWLSSFEFWEEIINYMIEKEIKKNEDINKDKDKSEVEKKNNNNNIAFSQIFSYTNNMTEFNINKNEINSFIEKICKKYELDSDMINSIINNINKKIEEKEALLIKDPPKEELKNIEEIKEDKVLKEKDEKNNINTENNENNIDGNLKKSEDIKDEEIKEENK